MEILADVDAGAAFPMRTMPKVLCCLCGVDIDPNAANMCVNCLRNQVDITEGIPKQIILHHCRGCDRYLRPPWCACELESRELLAICLKKISGLTKVRLVDAGFIWTEPHSRRLKVKLVIQKEVLNGVRLQQVFAVEFVLQNQQCDSCQRSYTDHTWRALVQVRQKVDHKKTFFLLEQLILRHRAHEKCINVEQVPAGVDFSFGERSHALKFIDFLGSVVPMRSKSAKQLISEDTQSGVQNFKFTYAVEIVPLVRDDLVVMPAKSAAAMGHINSLALVQRVSNHVFFVDPRSLQMAEMTSDRYWAEPFRPLMSGDRLEEFMVLDVTAVTIAPITGTALRRKQGKRAAAGSSRGGASSRGDDDSDGSDEEGAGEGATASAGGAGSRSGGSSVGFKRRRDDDNASTIGASSVAGGSTYAGGFTGAVSIAGGSIRFHGASSVASTVTGGHKGRMLLADVEVMKVRDMGRSDTRYTVRSHLGNILRPGDLALGFDLTNAVYNDADAEAASLGGRSKARGTARGSGKFELPDIVLVRKTYRRKGDGGGVSAASTVGDDDGASTVVSSSILSRKERKAAARATAAAVAAGGGEVEMGGSAGAGEGAGAGAGSDAAADASSAAPARPSAAAPAAGSGGGASKQRRLWKLKRLDEEVPTTHSDATRKGDEARRAAEFESFLRDIEDDPALRKSLNLYKDGDAIAARKAAGLALPSSAKAGRGGRGGDIGAAARGAAAAPASKVRFGGPAAKPAEAAAASALKPAAAAAGAGGEADGDDAGDSDSLPGAEGPPDIGLEELLDDMTLGKGAGDDDDEDEEEGGEGAAAAAASASAASAGAGKEGAGAAAASDASAAGAYVDPEDAKLIAAYRARERRVKKLAAAAGAGGADAEDDAAEDASAAPAAPAPPKRSGRTGKGSRAAQRRRDTAFAAPSGGRALPLVPEAAIEEEEEDKDGDEL